MTRSPLFYPLNRGTDGEPGGVADLQTDVMRFIAILALCLVAIFALVQSIPLLPSRIEQPAEKPLEKPDREVLPDPVMREPEKPAPVEETIVITRPAPKRIPMRSASPKIIERSIPPAETVVSAMPATDTPLPEPSVSVPVPQSAAPTEKAFTLRFETDAALTRLVARNEVGLYAITPEKSLRMNVNRATFSFWPASVPNRFHEMDETTVPEGVLAALRRAGSLGTGNVKWGVTLPADMRRKLNSYLDEYEGGSLIISGDGDLRMEP